LNVEIEKGDASNISFDLGTLRTALVPLGVSTQYTYAKAVASGDRW